MSFFVPTRFVWRFGGRQVHLCGSFTCWVETVPMAPVEGSPGVFAVVVHLPPGYHQYKFIVDGKWRHDDTAPYMQDPLGNVNNWLYVRKIDPAQQQPGNIPGQLQHPAQQQALAAALQPQQQQVQVQAQAQQQLTEHQLQQVQQQVQQAQQQQVQQQQQQLHPQLAHINVHHVPPQQQQLQQPQPHPQHLPQQHPQPLPHPGSVGLPPHQRHPQQSQGQDSPLSQHQAPSEDVDMTSAEQVAAPLSRQSVLAPKEPDNTRKKVSDFLHAHTAYELIPESGQVVLVDVDLPVRQAFHALHEQGIASAPLWDSQESTIIGVISASDFIHILKRLRSSVSSGANPMNEVEMDAHTIRGLREEAALDGRDPKHLVYVRPEDSLARVVRTLSDHKCSMAPVLSKDPHGREVPDVLHVATLSGVLACIMRHFRTALASLPVLAQPLSALPIGTWSPDSPVATPPPAPPLAPASPTAASAPSPTPPARPPKIQQLHTVHPSTPLTAALSLLLDAGVSALPVVDEKRRLLDLYARADITKLCKGNAYNRLQWEDVTVGQALALNNTGPPVNIGGGPHAMAAQPPPQQQRVCTATRNDLLRDVLDRLSKPGVRRVVVVHPETRCVEGLISLSDVASFLFL